MFETALSQLRLAVSLLFAVPFNPRSLDRLVKSMRQTRDEFGALSNQANEFVSGPILDEQSRAEMQLRRFRKQATRAARETLYYNKLFREFGEDPSKLTHQAILKLPFTTKEALRESGDAFVRHSAKPVYRMMTTGTTGRPTSTWFSEREMQTYYAFSAMSLLLRNVIDPCDIVQLTTSSRALLGNACFMEGCARVGAAVYQTGLLDPLQILDRLSEKQSLPGKKSKVSVLFTYPSYLGHLIACGLENGFRPTDFSIEKIALGGEIVTEGVKSRAQELFGPVQFIEGYGITETWPQGGDMCNEGHLHFEPSQGLMEVISLDEERPSRPEEPGTLVLTPFPPFRETTLLLRYNTEDVVHPVQGPMTCSHRHIPAVSNILGKLKHAVQHDHGWTFPREILEALEAVDAIPLPARCRYWAVPGGVAVEVYTTKNTTAVQTEVAARLESSGVPLQALYLRDKPENLQNALPRRGDLRELSFDASLSPNGQD